MAYTVMAYIVIACCRHERLPVQPPTAPASTVGRLRLRARNRQPRTGCEPPAWCRYEEALWSSRRLLTSAAPLGLSGTAMIRSEDRCRSWWFLTGHRHRSIRVGPAQLTSTTRPRAPAQSTRPRLPIHMSVHMRLHTVCLHTCLYTCI